MRTFLLFLWCQDIAASVFNEVVFLGPGGVVGTLTRGRLLLEACDGGYDVRDGSVRRVCV